jgi:hypothetical protein
VESDSQAILLDIETRLDQAQKHNEFWKRLVKAAARRFVEATSE